MTRPYSEDLRERAVARYEAGETTRSIAAALRISPSCVSKWMKLKRETGSLAPGKVGGHKKRMLSGEPAAWLRERCRSGPFTTRGLTAELLGRGIKSDRRAVWVFLHAEGLSFKKNRAGPSRCGPTSPASGRAGRPVRVGLSRDGSSSSTRPGSRPTWRPCAAGGRADRGSRPACRTAIGRRSPSSPPCDAIASTWVIDGPINGELFTLYVEKVLGPTLAKGDVVILDNLGSHKGQAARRAIRAAGAHLLFLPPYSPDLNPIEQLFAKLKHLDTSKNLS
jgi:transposase